MRPLRPVESQALRDSPTGQGRTPGRLRIYLGAAPGVGKTYAMLCDARLRRARGTDLLIGLVDTHGFTETEALCKGLEALAPRAPVSQGQTQRELDVTAAIERRPELILIDDLAHRNPESSARSQRWQDIEEMLEHGIDVYTTLNVHNIESLKETVYECSKIRFRETVPDRVLERADEIVVVDIPPQALSERLREGKVFLAQPERMSKNLFDISTLACLRNLALRIAVDHQEAQRLTQDRGNRPAGLWPANKKVLVAIDHEPVAEQIIRGASRLASLLHADWIVVYLETNRGQRLSARQKEGVHARLRLAQELGAEVITLTAGYVVARQIIELARQKNVGRIVLEQPTGSAWQRWRRSSLARALGRDASDLDIFLIAPAHSPLAQDTLAGAARPLPLVSSTPGGAAKNWHAYLWSIGIPAGATLISSAIFRQPEPANHFIVYLLGVLFIASRFGFWPSAIAAILSVLASDYLLIPPYFSFAVARPQDVVTLLVFLLGALVASRLTADLRLQSESARLREQRVRFLYEFTKALGGARTMQEVASVAAHQISNELHWQSEVLLARADGRVSPLEDQIGAQPIFDLQLAQSVFDNRKAAGWGTGAPSQNRELYLPVSSSTHRFGVLALRPITRTLVLLPEQRRLLDTVLSQIGQALERIRLTEEAHTATVQVATESLRNSLLSAIAHDLRTPLASIVAASSTLLQERERLSALQTRELTQTILEEGQRMTKLANDTLQMARLEAGTITLHRDWYPIEEIIGAALSRMEGRLKEHVVETRLPAGVPMAQVDEVMIVQVLENLIENAIKYTPGGTRIEVGAEEEPDRVRFWVADQGPGIPTGEERKIFEKFYQSAEKEAKGGVGLGLTICRIIVEAHGGQILGRNRTSGGAEFSFTIPFTDARPQFGSEQ